MKLEIVILIYLAWRLVAAGFGWRRYIRDLDESCKREDRAYQAEDAKWVADWRHRGIDMVKQRQEYFKTRG